MLTLSLELGEMITTVTTSGGGMVTAALLVDKRRDDELGKVVAVMTVAVEVVMDAMGALEA